MGYLNGFASLDQSWTPAWLRRTEITARGLAPVLPMRTDLIRRKGTKKVTSADAFLAHGRHDIRFWFLRNSRKLVKAASRGEQERM